MTNRLKSLKKIDILDELNEVLGTRPGIANSDINVLAIIISVPYHVLADAREEIARLREASST